MFCHFVRSIHKVQVHAGPCVPSLFVYLNTKWALLRSAKPLSNGMQHLSGPVPSSNTTKSTPQSVSLGLQIKMRSRQYCLPSVFCPSILASKHPVMWLAGRWAYKCLLVDTMGFFPSALGNVGTGRRFCFIWKNSKYGIKGLKYLPYVCSWSRTLQATYAWNCENFYRRHLWLIWSLSHGGSRYDIHHSGVSSKCYIHVLHSATLQSPFYFYDPLNAFQIHGSLRPKYKTNTGISLEVLRSDQSVGKTQAPKLPVLYKNTNQTSLLCTGYAIIRFQKILFEVTCPSGFSWMRVRYQKCVASMLVVWEILISKWV